MTGARKETKQEFAPKPAGPKAMSITTPVLRLEAGHTSEMPAMRPVPLCSDPRDKREGREVDQPMLPPQASALPRSLVGALHTARPTNCSCHPSWAG